MAIRSIFKALAGLQDAMWGRGSVTQSRNGTDYTIDRIAKVHPVDLLVDIKAVVTTDPDNQYFEVLMKGTVAINDGNGGNFYYDATSLLAPDDLSVILPDDVPLANPGRWLKQAESGLLRTGDTATGPIRGVPPVAASDFTRKDYTDALYNLHLAGPLANGTTLGFTGNLNTIAVNSLYIADAAVVLNEPPGFNGVGLMTVFTTIGTSGSNRVQLVTAISSILARQRYIRTTNVGDAGWSSWRKLSDMYDDDGNEVLVQADTIIDAVNYLEVVNSATGAPTTIRAAGQDTDVGLTLSSKGAGHVKAFGGPPGGRQGVFRLLDDFLTGEVILSDSGTTDINWTTVTPALPDDAVMVRLHLTSIIAGPGTTAPFGFITLFGVAASGKSGSVVLAAEIVSRNSVSSKSTSGIPIAELASNSVIVDVPLAADGSFQDLLRRSVVAGSFSPGAHTMSAIVQGYWT